MENISDELLAKIAKLFTLAEHPTASPGEAANAAAMAHTLLMRYNLDISAVRRAQGQGEALPITIEAYTFAGSGATRWRRDLIETLASVNLCRYIGTMKAPTKGKLVGQAHNIQVVAYLATMLMREIGRLARLAWRELDSETQARFKQNSWLTSFCMGATRTVQRRLMDAKRESEAAHDATMALVVVHKEQITQFVDARMSVRDMKPRYHKVFSTPFQTGKEAGETIALHTGIGAGGADKALKAAS